MGNKDYIIKFFKKLSFIVVYARAEYIDMSISLDKNSFIVHISKDEFYFVIQSHLGTDCVFSKYYDLYMPQDELKDVLENIKRFYLYLNDIF